MSKRAQKQKDRTRTPRNQRYAEGMQELRRSNAAGTHRSARDYERRPKHMGQGYGDE